MRPLLHLVTVLLILWGAPQIVTAASEDLPLPFHAFDEQAREKVEALLRDHTLKRLLLLKHPILSRPLHQFQQK